MLKDKLKEIPPLQHVAGSLELMSAAGRRRMMEQPWITDPATLDDEQRRVALLRGVQQDAACAGPLNRLRHQLMQLHDLHATLESLRGHFLLGEVELFEIKNLAFICGHAREALAEMGLTEAFPLPDITPVFHLLDPDDTGIPNFYIYDSNDPRLAPLRRQMAQADETLMGKLLARQNEVQQQVIERLCDRLQPYAESLVNSMESMAYIDFAQARAELADRWGLTAPTRCGKEEGIAYHGLFEPRLRQHNEEQGLRYQPIDVAVVRGVTFVTGANMAGKTVLLKSIALAQLMYQFGFPLPAAEARLHPVEDVLICIGDEQNEMQGLSSFASEITRIDEVLVRSRQEHLLVLIDEPARTTNPIEGKALVQSIANIMESRDSLTVITTHYSQLGLPCRRLRVRGFVEAMVDKPLTPQTINRYIDYSLVPDQSDEVPQEALRIAEMLACDPELVATARKYLEWRVK